MMRSAPAFGKSWLYRGELISGRTPSGSRSPSRLGSWTILFLSVLLSGCNPFPDTWRWNQKLTVEVSTPDGIRSGSAVTEVVWQERNWTGNFPGSYHGEATVVDLGQGRYLFALIGEPTRYLALRTFAPDLGDKAVITEEGFAAMARIRGTRDVREKYYPILMTFDDITNPETARRLDPSDLGLGLKIHRIKLEIIDFPEKTGNIDNILPKEFFERMGDIYQNALKGGGIEDKFFRKFASTITRNNFIRELSPSNKGRFDCSAFR